MRSSFFLRCLVSCYLSLLISWTSIASPLPRQVAQEVNVLTPYKTHIQAKLNANKTLVSDISEQLHSKDLPRTLVLLPMLESSFNPNAVSHANAAGLWQLIPETARRFGLEVSETEDQRFNTSMSTEAAINYLSFLYGKFGDLTLTIAAYNAGEGRVARAIQKTGSNQYSQLTLPSETTQYVNRFYALKSLVELDHLIEKQNQSLFLFGQTVTEPLIDLKPLPPLITL